MELSTVPFDAEKIKIRPIFKSNYLDDYTDIPVPSNKVREVYGNDISFPKYPKNRPYIFSSFVMSIDGKLAYADKPSAFYVAGKNKMAGGGKDTDFWILNVLRANCDAAIIGGNSMKTDADYMMYCMDEQIQQDRENAGLSKIPLNIIMSLDASDVPMNHQLLKSKEVPAILATSPEGLAYMENHFKGKYVLVRPEDNNLYEKLAVAGTGVLPILVTGQGHFPNSQIVMSILKKHGINRLLIESPGYGNYLVRQKMMDEFFLNMSGVYIGGGDTMTLGKADKGFSAESHPHAQLLSAHIYNEYFTYLRYRFCYDFME